MTTSQWLQSTTAADIMRRKVVTLNADDPLAAAAATLLREQISGAPVIDEAGNCIGVLSVSDISSADNKVVKKVQEIAQSSFWSSNLVLPASVYAEKLAEVRDKIIPASEQPVRNFMTTDLVAVAADSPMQRVVQSMVDAHIHRVVVTDENRKLLGIISTTDILAALLRSA